MRLTRILVLLFTLACALALSAQKHPNIELGFNPDRLYHYTELDSVNLFNGNLIIQIPIGGSYHANAAFQYNLTLVYNAKVWDYRRDIDGADDYVYSDPNWRSNAGVGWRISLGRLFQPSFLDSHYPGNDKPAWIYEGPSGDEHVFSGAIANPDLWLTADQSHLRMKKIDDDDRDVEFPNGDVHHFHKNDGRWELTNIADRHGNSLAITNHHNSQGKVTSWDLVDSTGRTHHVYFTAAPSLVTADSVDRGQLVSSVELSTGEGHSTYRFEYEFVDVMWGCGHHARPDGDDDYLTPKVNLPLLKRVVLPDDNDVADDNTAYSFSYYLTDGATTGAGQCGQGMMETMTVPTGGMTTYEYQIYDLPRSFCLVGSTAETNPGVKARITPDGRWDYGLTLGKPMDLDPQINYAEDCGREFEVPGYPSPPVTVTPPRHWSRTTVLSPPVPYKASTGYVDRRQRTDNYFYVWFANEPLLDMHGLPEDPLRGGKQFAIGRPFTSGAPADGSADALCNGCESEDNDEPAADDDADPNPRHLSTRMYEGCASDGSCSGGRLLRSTYLRSLMLFDDPDFGPMDPLSYDSTRTVFEDDDQACGDVACWTQTESTDPDGAGHFRQEEMTTNFPKGGGFINVTNFLGMTDAAAANTNTKWLLERFDSKTHTEDGVTTKSEYCFNALTGFLEGVRVLKGTGLAATDVLTTFESDHGNVLYERSYGGDIQGALSTDDACVTSAPHPTHLIRNEYQRGLLAKSQYCDPEGDAELCASILTMLDLTIDTSGQATHSRDASGIDTQYVYGADGRLKTVIPTGGATSSYAYFPAVGDDHARVEETVGTDLVKSVYTFDGLGRLIHLEKSLPGVDLFSAVDTVYDALSRKTQSSTAYQSDTPSTRKWTTTTFDAFGRPLEVTAPDDKKTTFTYTGNRERTRTAAVATSLNGTTDATVTEQYDAQSRLRQVDEFAAGTDAEHPIGGLVSTQYGYDGAGHLTTVDMDAGMGGTQERSFHYDGRGFLTLEHHPENDDTTYVRYDPRGHVEQKITGTGTLKYEYDRAERLRKVFNGTGANAPILKEFIYSNANDRSKGKLVTALRRNQLPSAGTIDVTETYEYDGKIGGIYTGQLSNRKTLVESVQGTNRTTIQEFDYTVDQYDELRLPKTVLMPTCSTNGCSVSGLLPSLDYKRDHGFLKSVGTVDDDDNFHLFGDLTYHPSGMVYQVTHKSSPEAVDTYDQTDGIARPSKITFSGGSCAAPQPPVITAGSVCGTATTTASVPSIAGVTHTWTITGGSFTGSGTGDSVSFQASGSTVTLTVTAANSCGQSAPVTKTITAGSAPEPSVMTTSPALCNAASGTASVPAREGITHTWTITGGVIDSATTGETITFHPTGTGLAVLKVTATNTCGSATTTRPVIVSAPPTATLNGSSSIFVHQSTEIPVDLTGVGPWNVTWSDGQTDHYLQTPGRHEVGPFEEKGKYTYTVTAVSDANNCAGTFTGSYIVDVEQTTPQSVQSYQKFHSRYSPSHAADLWIDMSPTASSQAVDPGFPSQSNPNGVENWHHYEFRWFEDDGIHPLRELNGTGREVFVQPDTNAVYWAEITGKHRLGNTTAYYETTVSPKMYVSLYGDCHLPTLHVAQSAGHFDAGTVGAVQFTASVDWPNVDYQWYRGQTGDTREPIDSDDGKPGQLTVAPSLIRPYWVRASLECGEHKDSATLIYSMGSCGPVLIDLNVPDQDVAFGGDASLHVDSMNVPDPDFKWYRGVDDMDPVEDTNLTASQPTLEVQNVVKSGRYWVRVRNGECSASAPAKSYVATVRVASCGNMTPPSPRPTEFWADLGGTATLSVSVGNATTYEWYKGELGDESQLVQSGNLSTYVTENLTEETKYWVRVRGASNCLVDSPTITVKICAPPLLTGNWSIETNENIVPGQWAAFSVAATGTDLHYTWYEGDYPHTDHPVGEPVNKLMVHPTVTTSYWVDVWSVCGPGGGDVRHLTPNTRIFKASVCPVVTDAPVAAQSIVMPGTATTLTIGEENTAYDYQWYVGDPAIGPSTPMGSPTHTHTITTPPITQTTTFWVSVKSGGCERPSPGVTVAVCPAPSIYIPVPDDTVAAGTFEVLSVSGVPQETPVQYQWYQGAANDTTHPISSQATAGVTPMTTTSYWVRVTFTDTNCHADSPVVTIQVCVPTITSQPIASSLIDKTTNPNASVHLAVGVDISGATYQWYIGQPNDTSNPIAGATSSSYDASPASTTTYWVRVIGSCLTWANSAAATVNVCYAPVVISMSPSQYIQAGTPTTVSVNVTGTNLTYKWYEGASGDITHPVANSSSAAITVSPATTTSYWAQIKSEGSCTTNSAAVTVDVCTTPTFSLQPLSQASFAGKPLTLTAAASSTSGAVTYQWYRGVSGDTANPISGATSASVSVAPAIETSYWVRASKSVCTTDSATATITMCLYPEVVTPSPAEKLIVYNGNATLQLPPLSPVDNVQVTWYRGASGDHTNIVGSALNLTSFTTPALTADTQYWAEFTNNTCVSRTTTYTVRVCKPTITTPPTGGTIQSGQNLTLTVGTTAISGQTFQWYTGASGNTSSPVANATTASVTVNPTTTTTYWVRVTGTCGVSADSAAVTVTVCNPPVITGINANPAFIQAGSSTTLSVSATAVNKTYQWFIGASGNTSSPVANSNNGTIVVSPASTTSYWVQVKSEGLCTANSSAVTVDVCTTPVITTQPQSQTIRTGNAAALTVATSTSGATYQWYQGAPGTTTTPLGTTATINVSPTTDTQYWVRITKGACSVDSNGATVTVCAITASVANVNAASGQNATMTATVTNARAAVTYAWYLGNSGTTTTLVGGTQSITVNRTANTNYWVRVSDGTCTIDSATATLNVCIPTITTQPQSSTITSGQSTTLTVAATASPLTYQWYVGDAGVTTSPISGATSASYTTPALSTTTKYWVKVTGCSIVNSVTATVTVCTAPTAPTPTKSTTMYPGNAGWVSVSATGTGLTYQWYKGNSGDTSNPISGATAATYNFTLSVSQYYWVRVTGTCGTANSPAVLYSVTPTITVQPQSASVPYGSTPSLTVTATGNYLTYQWYNASNQAISGATAATYTTPAVTGATSYTVRVSSGSLTANSDAASLTICTGPSVTFTSQQWSAHSYTLIMTLYEEADVKYQWYTGTPGNVSQSTPQGTIGGQTQWYLGNVTQPTTWWVRAWYSDDHCYTDTQGITVN